MQSKKPILPLLTSLMLVGIAPVAVAQGSPIDEFRAGLEAQNEALKASGLEMYANVELVDEATARVTVTEDWMRVVTPDDPSGNLNVMFDNWRFTHGADKTGIRLIVVAPDGSIIREMSN